MQMQPVATTPWPIRSGKASAVLGTRSQGMCSDIDIAHRNNQRMTNTTLRPSTPSRSTRPTRFETAARWLNHFRPASALVLCSTKQPCKELMVYLQQQGFSALAL